MIPQLVTNETITVITPNGISFPQVEKPTPTNQRQESLKKRLKAEIKVIGTIQLLCGVMVLSVGIILGSAPSSPHFTPVFSILLKSSYPFTGALCFVISGSLSIITEKKSTKPLVHSSLALGILSSLFAAMGIIVLSVNLAALGPASQQCELSSESRPTSPYNHYHEDRHKTDCLSAYTTLTGAVSVMLVCSVLELCLAVLTAVLWWNQAHSSFPGSVLFLPQILKNKSSTSSKASSAYEELLST